MASRVESASIRDEQGPVTPSSNNTLDVPSHSSNGNSSRQTPTPAHSVNGSRHSTAHSGNGVSDGVTAASSSSPSSSSRSSSRRGSIADSHNEQLNHSALSSQQHRHPYTSHQSQQSQQQQHPQQQQQQTHSQHQHQHQPSPVKQHQQQQQQQPQQRHHQHSQRQEKSRPAPLNIDQHPLPQQPRPSQHQHIHQQHNGTLTAPADPIATSLSSSPSSSSSSSSSSTAANTLGVPAMQMASMGVSSPLQQQQQPYGQPGLSPMTSPLPITPGITSPALEHPLPSYNPAQSTYHSNAGLGAGAGNTTTAAPAPAAPYLGRAASLPGSLHHGQHGQHGQHSSSGRHPRTSSHNHNHQQNHNANAYAHAHAHAHAHNSHSHQMAAAAAAAAGIGMPSVTLGGHQQQAVPASLLRGSPQLRAQLAQHLAANGNLPGAFGGGGGGGGSSSSSSMHGGMGMGTLAGTGAGTGTGAGAHMQPAIPYERYTAELTNCIIAFLSPILPTEEEYRIKEATRRQLERLAGKVSPGSKLLAFGSMANGFALRNSDMDLCCLIGRRPAEHQEPHPTASQLVEMLAKVIREETDFNVLPLPKARIPIIKISRASTPELPYEISCDIGFENRLALENTRLLLSYAMVDPPRLRTLVLFLKVWTKRRKLNSPYMGTLSSYGYTLLVLFFLTHVKRPAVLPNLQRIPPTRPLAPEEIELNGHNIYFYDDMATLRKEWQSQNTENVAELLIDFFRYFAKEFAYTRDVISLRTEGGLIPKDGVTWAAELCIEDPFQLGYNVSRTVTKDGLYTIRGEFMRSMRILQNRHQRVSAQLAELCEEREDIVARAPDTPPPRNKYSHLGGGSTPMNSYMSASDARSMYDNARRGSNTTNASGFGGSFAFEEMARGLGRQRGQMAYPTAAMLAPLSQNGGLSPRPTNVTSRVARDLSTPGRSSAARSAAAVASSARSDDGKGSGLAYEEAPQADNHRPSHASARTSPTLGPAVPHGLPPSNAVGEAWAFGSEIVFGSERFQLHPHRRRRASTSKHHRGGGDADSVTSTADTTTSAGMGDETIRQSQGQTRSQSQSHALPASLYARGMARPGAGAGAGVGAPLSHLPAAAAFTASPTVAPPKTSSGAGHRTSRSFSDGQSRSQSVPRVGASSGSVPGVNGGAMQPSSLSVAGHGQRTHAEGLYAPMASLSVHDGGGGGGGGGLLAGDLTDTNSSGRQSPGASSDAPSQSGESAAAPMREYTAAWAQRQQQLGPAGAQGDDPTALQMDYIPPSSSDDDDDDGGSPLHDVGSAGADTEEMGRRRDGDGDSDLSEGMLDELSRISQIETEGRGHHSRNSSYAEAKLGFGAVHAAQAAQAADTADTADESEEETRATAANGGHATT